MVYIYLYLLLFPGNDEKDEALIIERGKKSNSGFSLIFEALDAKCRNKKRNLYTPQHKYGTRMAKKLKTGRYSY